MKEGNPASTRKKNARDYKIYKFIHSMRRAQGKKKNTALYELKEAQKDLQRPDEHREMMVTAFSG